MTQEHKTTAFLVAIDGEDEQCFTKYDAAHSSIVGYMEGEPYQCEKTGNNEWTFFSPPNIETATIKAITLWRVS